MRKQWVTAVVMVALALVIAPGFAAMVPEADAADAKAKCRVGTNPARVQIGVDADGLAKGFAQFQVTSGGNTSSVLSDKVDPFGDAAAEWDSAIDRGDPAEGARGSIDANFVGVGGTVDATVSQHNAVVATATATCVRK